MTNARGKNTTTSYYLYVVSRVFRVLQQLPTNGGEYVFHQRSTRTEVWLYARLRPSNVHIRVDHCRADHLVGDVSADRGLCRKRKITIMIICMRVFPVLTAEIPLRPSWSIYISNRVRAYYTGPTSFSDGSTCWVGNIIYIRSARELLKRYHQVASVEIVGTVGKMIATITIIKYILYNNLIKNINDSYFNSVQLVGDFWNQNRPLIQTKPIILPSCIFILLLVFSFFFKF